MRTHQLQRITVGAVVVLLVLSAVLLFRSTQSYTVKVALDSATNVVKGGPVLLDGFDAGSVTDLQVKDGKAVVTLELDDEFGPLHDGALVQVGWKATLSERLVEVTDGPSKNAEVPDGGMLHGDMPRAVEVDEILNALDTPTRKKIQSLVGNLEGTLEGSEKELNETINTAGPALGALGQVLQGLGTDGPAIKNLVTRLDDLMGVVATRDTDVQQIIGQLDTLTSQVAGRREQLRTSLKKLPGTLEQAESTLASVPETVEDVTPLLEDLEPATARLLPVSKNLRPVLQDLRPLTADLRPTLQAASDLLAVTPGLLDDTHSVVPQATTLVKNLQAPVEFLRPYAPETFGFFSTWASAFANYDRNGNFARILGQAGPTSFNENPGIVPPGVEFDPYPAPGAVVDQPWTDATGSEVR